MEGSEYYESLIQQGYSSEQAEQHTAQHYPGFTAQKQMPVIQDSVVGGNLHSGDIIHHHHHHAAPVVQAAPPQQYIFGSAQSAAQPVYVVPNQKKIFIVPWIGIGLIVFMMLMPFVQLTIEGEEFGDSTSGFGVIGEVIESAADSDGSSGDGGGLDVDDFPEEWIFFGIATLLLMFSPFVYLLFAAVSTGMLILKKHTLAIGVMHLVFFGVFLICSLIGTVNELGLTISVHSNLAGWGFFGAGLAGILLCIKA